MGKEEKNNKKMIKWTQNSKGKAKEVKDVQQKKKKKRRYEEEKKKEGKVEKEMKNGQKM